MALVQIKEINGTDLFDWQVEFLVKTLLEPSKKFGPYKDPNKLEKVKQQLIKREVMETVWHMMNTRTSQHVFPYLNQGQADAVRRAERNVKYAGNVLGFYETMIYLRDHVLPLLKIIKPGEASRFRKNYMLRMEALESYLTEILDLNG